MINELIKNKKNLILLIYLLLSSVLIYLYSNSSKIKLTYNLKIYEDKIINNYNETNLAINSNNFKAIYEQTRNDIGKAEQFNFDFNNALLDYKNNNKISYLNNFFIGISRLGYIIFEVEAEKDIDRIKLGSFLENYLEQYFNNRLSNHIENQKKLFFERRSIFIEKYKNIQLFLDRLIKFTSNQIYIDKDFLRSFFEDINFVNQNYFSENIINNYKSKLAEVYQSIENVENNRKINNYEISIYLKNLYCKYCVRARELAGDLPGDNQVNVLIFDRNYNQNDFLEIFNIEYNAFLLPYVTINGKVIGDYYDFKDWYAKQINIDIKDSITNVKNFLMSKEVLDDLYNNLINLYSNEDIYNDKVKLFMNKNINIIKLIEFTEKKENDFFKLFLFNLIIILFIYLIINFLLFEINLIKNKKL